MKGISAADNMPGWVISNTFTPGYKVQDGAHAMYSCQDGILWAHAMYLCQDGAQTMYLRHDGAQTMYLRQDLFLHVEPDLRHLLSHVLLFQSHPQQVLLQLSNTLGTHVLSDALAVKACTGHPGYTSAS